MRYSTAYNARGERRGESALTPSPSPKGRGECATRGGRVVCPLTGIAASAVLGPALTPGRSETSPRSPSLINLSGPLTGLLASRGFGPRLGSNSKQEPRERGWTRNVVFGLASTRRKRRAYYRGAEKGRQRPSAFRLPSSLAPRPSPLGFTLIEMLIVVSIMMILVAAAATMMRPATESRRIREAARAINVYLSSARNRAMETGRPCGVMLRRLQGAQTAVLTLDQCEVPPCYCGEMEQSVARVTQSGTDISVALLSSASGGPETLPSGMVRPNDLIQFNCQGPMYRILLTTEPLDGNGYFLNTLTTLSATILDLTQAPSQPWSATPLVLSYRIYRTPVKGAAQPLQLPAGAVIDLYGSGIYGGVGIDPGTWEHTVMILFAANGSVDRIYAPGVPPGVLYPTAPIFLLVGKRDRVGKAGVGTPTSANEPDWANWQDLNNLWVVINPQTGLVTSGEVASGGDVNAARGLARDAQSMGGK